MRLRGWNVILIVGVLADQHRCFLNLRTPDEALDMFADHGSAMLNDAFFSQPQI
jgi:hypothetical protein